MVFKRLDWCCFISQTGGELVQLCQRLKILPNRVITNNQKKISESSWKFFRENGIIVVCIPFKPTWEHYRAAGFNNLVTLHGYLRILPKEYFGMSCSCNTYNGHPGLITEYPELKGFNPQDRAFEGRYTTIGSVVHEVTEGVDEGKVVATYQTTMTGQETLDEYYDRLRTCSLLAWDKFFVDYLESVSS